MLQLLKKGKKGKVKKDNDSKGATSNKSKDDLLPSLPSVPSGLPSLPFGSDPSSKKSTNERKMPDKTIVEVQKKVDGVKDDGSERKKIQGSKGLQQVDDKKPGQGLEDSGFMNGSKGPGGFEMKDERFKSRDLKEQSSKVNNVSGQVEVNKGSSKKTEVPQTEVLKLSNNLMDNNNEDSNPNIQASKLNIMADSEESKLSIESKKMEENSEESFMVKESKKSDKKSDQAKTPETLIEKSDTVPDDNVNQLKSSSDLIEDLKAKSTSGNSSQLSSSSPRLPAEKKIQERTKKRDGVISGQIERPDSTKRAKMEPSPASKIISGVNKDKNLQQEQQPEIKPKHPLEATASRNPKKNSKDDNNNSVSQSLIATASIPEYDGKTPVGWEKRTSRTCGKPYYLNMYTKKSQWNVPGGPADPPAVPMETIICRHILIKHKDSRWPYSWRKDSDSIQRTRQEALEALEQHRKDILSGELYFADVASAYSDCSSAAVGGDLGKFTRGVMLEAFENVAFALEVKQVSEIVETECGYHLIMRLA